MPEALQVFAAKRCLPFASPPWISCEEASWDALARACAIVGRYYTKWQIAPLNPPSLTLRRSRRDLEGPSVRCPVSLFRLAAHTRLSFSDIFKFHVRVLFTFISVLFLLDLRLHLDPLRLPLVRAVTLPRCLSRRLTFDRRRVRRPHP